MLTGTGNHASSDAPFGHAGRLHLRRRAAGRRNRPQLRLPGEQHRQHRHHRRAGERSVHRRRSCRSRRSTPSLAPLTDVYFRGYDNNYPDLWRYNEWKREFDQFVANGNLPSLSLVRFSHDHMGNFASGARRREHARRRSRRTTTWRSAAWSQAVAQSRYAADTLIIVTEDDCQDGPDHVDSHRATAYVVGPYVKQGAVVSTRYSQVNALRTIEDILGTEHINLNTAFQATDGRRVRHHARRAPGATPPRPRRCCRTTTLAQAPGGLGVKYASGPIVKPKHGAAVLGQGHRGLRLLRRRPRAAGPVQPRAVAGPHGRQALSGHQGPSCHHE